MTEEIQKNEKTTNPEIKETSVKIEEAPKEESEKETSKEESNRGKASQGEASPLKEYKKEDKKPFVKKPFKKNPRRFVRRERPKSDIEQRVIGIRRVARVVKGGRRFSFAVALVMGDKKGSVGVGTGKGTDTALAIGKAARSAKKNMVKISLTKTMSIPTDVQAKYSASIVQMRPSPGKGVSAGSSVRDVIEMAGIKDITAKLISRSKNKLNNALATVKALEGTQR